MFMANLTKGQTLCEVEGEADKNRFSFFGSVRKNSY